MTVWVVRAGRKGEREEDALQGNFATIGWNEIPDLTPIQDKEKLTTIYRQKVADATTPAKVRAGVGQVWAFGKRIEPGDLVVLPRLLKAQRGNVAVGEVTGPYCYRTDLGDHNRHTRAVRWLCKGIPRASFPEDLQKRFGLQPTVYRIKLEHVEEQIRAVLGGRKGEADEPLPLSPGFLHEVFETVRARIAKYKNTGLNEQDTKMALVNPVLCALGWRVGNLDEVRQEYKDADYAMFVPQNERKPILLVEAKALGEDLYQGKHAKQVMGYTGILGAGWAVLTNGDEYRIYNATSGAMSIEERLFRGPVRLTDPDSPAEETLALLSRQRIGDLERIWEDERLDRQVRAAIEKLFAPEPHSRLVDFVRKETGLTSTQIKASASRICQRVKIV